jgi:hypothetical protein
VRACDAGGQAPTPAVNALTTIAYYIKKNVNSPQLSTVLPLLGGADFTAEQLDTLLGVAFGLAQSGSSIPSTNYVASLLVGPPPRPRPCPRSRRGP